VRKAFDAVQKTADEALQLAQQEGAFKAKMADLGFPDMFGAISYAPFDYFGDYMRGAKGILTDIRRRPEKLLEAMDKAGVFILRQALGQSVRSNNKFVFIPIHWGPDGFMSPLQFKTIWWPSFKKLLLGLIENELIPVVLWEADCTSRLEVIGDMPRGKAVYWFERTDIYRAKEVLGDTVCIRGNVSPSLMTTGSPEEVDANCRQLIEKVGKDGGFILDTAFGIPDEAPVENVRAMYQSVRKYSS
jgi:uroporphyrinogen-III decarboxylase